MKKKLIASLSILAVLAFAIAAFAYTQNASVVASAASCCKSKDSCPMKMKGHGESGEQAKTSCCKHDQGEACDCCGDSCPMKKGEGDAVSAAPASSVEGEDCCDNCDCCKGKRETSI